MNQLQIIKSLEGTDEYVLLPMVVYQALQETIAETIAELDTSVDDDEYVPVESADSVENPVAFARINAGITRSELANRLGVSQSYIGKIERSTKVTEKMLARVDTVL